MPAQLPAPEGAIQILLRPLTAEDEAGWSRVRIRNANWLSPWDAGDPMHGPGLTFNTWLERQRRDERTGVAAQFAIEYQMEIIGQVSVGAISYGSIRSGSVGYWVDKAHAGLGVAPLSVAMLADWAMLSPDGPRLHRLEIAMLPENERSRRVVEKLGAHREGLRRQYMYIRGAWRDHDVYSLLADDAPGGFAARFLGR
ncbi:GNAT family protein [Bifidobacterium sp. ESL0790]|uniref:GNAT family N-acetyltransferase n=1 Tax=Bifidobacterium sp. ESL0790 TaxID=2983233 RepID=UPI0023F990F7|nr:GNAT family protein [Bifidobacterium sp. ESL0790]WEV73239.1 GNAT family protein [Bifidobacterium sp. ESL0790]